MVVLRPHRGAPPAVSMQVVTTSGDVRAILHWCARCELPPAGAEALRTLASQLNERAWEQVLVLARQHGLAPLVFKHLAQAHVLPLVPAHIVEALRSAYCSALVTNRRLAIELANVLVVFATRGVEALLLKGVVLAARYYHEVALRPSTDIDVLVRRDQLDQCLLALRDIGYLPKTGLGKALDFDVLYSLELSYRNESGVRVEPHLELARLPTYRAALSVDRVWARAQTIDVEGASARYLHPWDELRYLSVHYSIPHQAERLIWLVDVAELLRAHAADWDWEGFIQETALRGIAAPVAVTLQHAHDVLAVELPSGVLSRLSEATSTPREREAWIAARANASDARRLVEHAMSLQGVTQKLAFVWGAGLVGGRKVLRHLDRAFASR